MCYGAAMTELSALSATDPVALITSMGHGTGKGSREALGLTTQGPTRIITDLCVLEPDAQTRELTVTALHPGVTREQVQAAPEYKDAAHAEIVTPKSARSKPWPHWPIRSAR